MNLDLDLLHEVDKLKTGALVHDLNAMSNRYKSATTAEAFEEAETRLRRFVETIKRRKRNAPTCQHSAMKKYTVKSYSFLFCDDCGHSVDA